VRSYDTRLRGVLGPAHRELRWIAGLAEVSPLVSLAAVRLIPWVREVAIDAIAGRRAPFRPEGQCEAACLCSACQMRPVGARCSRGLVCNVSQPWLSRSTDSPHLGHG